MGKDELKEEIKISKGNGRYHERLIAMKLFSKGNKLSNIADTLEVSFPIAHSWANCEKQGLDGLKLMEEKSTHVKLIDYDDLYK